MYEIIFLGTGGGRFTTITQKRRTAGIRIIGNSLNLHLDPGPGALVYSVSSGLDPRKINAIMVSHCHPDHYNDAEVLIEAMTGGATRKRGILAAAKSVLRGGSVCEPSISNYHQQLPSQLIEATPGVNFSIAGVNVQAVQAKHSDPDTVGFIFDTGEFGAFAYTSDTEYFEGIGRLYKGVRLLMLCVLRPAGQSWKGHMTTLDAIKIIEETQPEQAIITHLGMQMISAGPEREAKHIYEKTSVPTIAARDDMRLLFGESIELKTNKSTLGLDKFF